MRFHKAYKELKKGMSSVDIIADAELSNRAVPTDSVIILGSTSDPYWTGKSRKIRELLGEQKFAVKGKGDAWGGFLSRIMEAPHMTDGYTEFYCLYLQVWFEMTDLFDFNLKPRVHTIVRGQTKPY